MKLQAFIAGEQTTVELKAEGTQFEATVDGRNYTLEARQVRPNVWVLLCNGHSIEAVVTEDALGTVVSLAGLRIPVQLQDPRKAPRPGRHVSHEGVAEVRAPMPGKIVRVLVNESDEVEASQPLVVMEAMKMQNEVRSPKKGTVKSLLVREGMTVSPGDVIALVE